MNIELLAEIKMGLLVMEVLLFCTSLFLMLLVLVQRGKGGGLTGALGGMGGQSAFGSKAGDAFTKITIITAAIWIGLCMVTIAWFNAPPPPKVASDQDVMIAGPDESADEDKMTGDSMTGDSMDGDSMDGDSKAGDTKTGDIESTDQGKTDAGADAAAVEGGATLNLGGDTDAPEADSPEMDSPKTDGKTDDEN